MLTSVKLTVLFNQPFWIGIFEIQEGDYYKVSKTTFGAEPKDAEVLEFVLRNYYKLRFSEQKDEEESHFTKKENPKRMQREIHKAIKNKGIGTKAQAALKEQYEANKIEHKKKSKEEKENEQMRKFKIKQEKKREKHKGH